MRKLCNAYNLVGYTFGRLTVLRPTDDRSGGCVMWLCRCTCGTEKPVRTDHLTKRKVRSCGCLMRETCIARSTTHGATVARNFAPEYLCWANMMRRCYEPTNQRFDRYGGRGITVCDRWHSYANFRADIGPRPEGLTLERINNDGNYEPSNCKWATVREQARNRRTTHMITHNSETMCLADWAKRIGRNVTTIRLRIERGLPMEMVLTDRKLRG